MPAGARWWVLVGLLRSCDSRNGRWSAFRAETFWGGGRVQGHHLGNCCSQYAEGDRGLGCDGGGEAESAGG